MTSASPQMRAMTNGAADRNPLRAPVPRRLVAKAKATALSEETERSRTGKVQHASAVLQSATMRGPPARVLGPKSPVSKTPKMKAALAGKGKAGRMEAAVRTRGALRSRDASAEPSRGPMEVMPRMSELRGTKRGKEGGEKSVVEFVGAPVGKQSKAWRNQKWVSGVQEANGPGIVTRSRTRAKAAAASGM